METQFLELFVSLLEEERIHMDPSLTFSQLCASMGRDEVRCDAEIYASTGFTGDEILDIYRTVDWDEIRDKYGFEIRKPLDNAVKSIDNAV